MLLTTYNPNGQASCGTCKKITNVLVLGGNLAYYPRYMNLRCKECGTEWKSELDKDVSCASNAS